jgi:hypothetical protein
MVQNLQLFVDYIAVPVGHIKDLNAADAGQIKKQHGVK